MELLKIEEYSEALKVFLKPTSACPEGSNFFYCDKDMKSVILNGNLNFSASYDSPRYPMLNGIGLHRFVKDTLGIKDAVVDHISGVTWDDCSCNLRVTDISGNAKNKRSIGLMYDGLFRPTGVARELLGDTGFRNEQKALIAISHAEKALRLSGYSTGYNFLTDRRDDADLVDLVRTDKLSKEDELITYIKRYSNNAWYYYRYIADLEKYKDLFDLDSVCLDEYGFLCSLDGAVLSPLSGSVDSYTYRLHAIEAKENDLTRREAEFEQRRKNLERKKLILKRQEEQLDDDITECTMDRLAFMERNNFADLEVMRSCIKDINNYDLGRCVKDYLVNNKKSAELLIRLQNVALGDDDDDFSLF